MALTDKLTDIADAIRDKTGGTSKLTLEEMATAIEGIQAGGGTEEIVGIVFDEFNFQQNMCTRCRVNGVTYLPRNVVFGSYVGPYITTIEISMVKASNGLGPMIEPMAFSNINSVTNITIKTKVDSIATNSFSGATNPNLVVNVPWAEGEVANAPWGCTAATINYNYKG